MQGTILNIAGQGGQGLIQGDDGARYTYTPMGWRNQSVNAFQGMKVDFEIRGAHAVGIYPLPGQVPPPPAPVISSGHPNQGPPPAPAPPAVGGHPNLPYQTGQTVPTTPSQGVQANVVVPSTQAAPESSDRVGKIVAGIAWMFLLSAFLSMFLSVIGAMIGGFVGGRKSGNFVNAVIAALISAIAVGGLTYVAVSAVVSFIEGLPIIGFLFKATPIGDFLKASAVIVALFHALPMLLLALLGGATAKK